jgi:hypothetical protein
VELVAPLSVLEHWQKIRQISADKLKQMQVYQAVSECHAWTAYKHGLACEH